MVRPWLRLTRHRRSERLDVGLQAERTALAWQRTALGVAGVSALLLHNTDRSAWMLAPALGLGFALVVLVVGELRFDQAVAQVRAGTSPARPRLMLLIAVGVVLLDLGVVAAVAFGPS